MDCQTESYSDVEGLKTKKDFSCPHCAVKQRASADSGPLVEVLPAPSKGFDLYAPPVNQPIAESFPSLYSESDAPAQLDKAIAIYEEKPEPFDDVLEIPEIPPMIQPPDPAKMEDVILFPVRESKSSPTYEEAEDAAPSVSETYEAAEGKSDVRFLTTAGPGPLAKSTHVDALSEAQAPAASMAQESNGSKKVGLISFSASKLTVIAAAFVLLTASLEIYNVTRGKESVKTESASRVIPTSNPSAVQAATPIQAQTAPAQTAPPVASSPTPAVVETRPVAPATDEQADKSKALFTVQVGAHKDESEANSQAEKLRAAGFEPRVVSVDIPNRGKWYRVQAGNFNDKDEANRFGAQILGKGAAETFVVTGL